MRSSRPALPLLISLTLGGASSACDRLGGHSADGDGASAATTTSASPPAAGGAGPTLAFLGAFEGQIDGFTRDASKPGAPPVALSAQVKAGKVRVEMPEGAVGALAGSPLGAKGYGIFDSAAKRLTVVSDARQQAVVIDLTTSGRSLSGLAAPGGHLGGPPSAPAAPSSVTRTGRMDTVAGYRCEYWDVASDHKTGSVCVGSDGPSWLSLSASALPASSAWMVELMDGKHFPLRFIGYGKDGATEESRAEITKIDKHPVADAVFQVPPGYRVIDLSQMMGGLGGMPHAPGMPPGMPGMPPGAPPIPRH